LHASSSTIIIPVSSDCVKASLGHAATHGGSSQSLHVTARLANGFKSRPSMPIGSGGPSLLPVLSGVLLLPARHFQRPLTRSAQLAWRFQLRLGTSTNRLTSCPTSSHSLPYDSMRDGLFIALWGGKSEAVARTNLKSKTK